MSDSQAKAIAWQQKHLYVPALRCPVCRSLRLQTTGSPRTSEPGIVKLQSKRCRQCQHTFQVHFE